MRAIRAAAETSDLDLTPLVPPLVELLAGGDEWSQDAAAQTLAAVGDPRAVEPLCALLTFTEHPLPDDLGPNPDHAVLAHARVSDDEQDVLVSAARALGALGDPRGGPALRACAQDDRQPDQVRRAARAALEVLEASGGG